MTREEAISALDGVLSEFCLDCPMMYEENCDCEAREAIDMAIEALSERDIARNIATILENEQDMRVMLQNAEKPKGEWKPFDLTWGRNVYFCTACKESIEVPTVNGQPSYNYCPNCGARMKGGAE